jgi:hypothetical protein
LRERYFGMNCLFWLYLSLLVSRRNMRDVIIKVLSYTYKIPDIFSDMLHWIFSNYFYRRPDVEVNENPFSGSRVIPRDTKNLIVVFGNLACTSPRHDKTPALLRSPWCFCVCGLSVSDTNYCTYWSISICTGHWVLLD